MTFERAAIAVALAGWCVTAFAWRRWRARMVAELAQIRRLLTDRPSPRR